MTSALFAVFDILIRVLIQFEIRLRVVGEEVVITFRRRSPAVRFKFLDKNKQEITMLILKDDEQATVTVDPVDAKGFAATVDGAPTWSASVDGVVTLEVAADGLSANIKAVAPGACQVNATGDADMGPDTKQFTSSLDVTVTASDAVGFNMTTGPVTKQ